jgi:hydroxyacylglutathione hydrolase
VRLRALATPGHTPESTSYAVFVPASPDKAWGVFTGDALFIRETGRTDLPDPERTGENAQVLFDALHAKILPLGDQTLLFPAHGAGSVCGGHIAEWDQSTIGLERLSNPVFTLSRERFVHRKVEERIPRPPYFSLMEKVNLEGGAAEGLRPHQVRLLQPEAFARRCPGGTVIDTRLPEAFAGGHAPGSYSIWLGGLPVFGGWVANADSPVYLVLDDLGDLSEAVLGLARIGVDGIASALAGGFEAWRDAGLPIETSGTITPRDLAERRSTIAVLDVREISEFEAGHVPGARHIYVGNLVREATDLGPEIRRDRAIAVTCSVGHRASLAVSALQRQGFREVSNVLGGMTAWKKLGLPQETGSERA